MSVAEVRPYTCLQVFHPITFLHYWLQETYDLQLNDELHLFTFVVTSDLPCTYIKCMPQQHYQHLHHKSQHVCVYNSVQCNNAVDDSIKVYLYRVTQKKMHQFKSPYRGNRWRKMKQISSKCSQSFWEWRSGCKFYVAAKYYLQISSVLLYDKNCKFQWFQTSV